MSKNLNLAIYVDGDNANYKDFSYVYKEIKNYGRIIIAKIYGDWTKNEMKGWKKISINYAFETPNCFSLSKKNSTDIYMICDILHDLYNNDNVDIFFIVSSDSDYTHVTKRIRSIGKKVIGIGRKKTPIMLKNSCDKFICTDLINEIVENRSESNELNCISKIFNGRKKIYFNTLKKKLLALNKFSKIDIDNLIKNDFCNNFKIIKNKNNDDIVVNISGIKKSIDNIFENYSKTEVNLSYIKDKLCLIDTSFDQRNYGFETMSKFINILFNKFYKVYNKNNSMYIKLL